MIWVFVEPGQLQNGSVEVSGPKGHHLARVLRVRPGEPGVAISEDHEYHFRVRAVQGDRVLGIVEEVRAISGEPPNGLTLLQAVLPNPDFDAVVEGVTALGVSRLVPVAAARSVARPSEDRRRRWQALAEATAEQSRRGRIPQVEQSMSLERALQFAVGSRLIVLDPSGAQSLSGAASPGVDHSLACGPEGGWTDKELGQLAAAGGIRVSLGPRILRARLAPLAAAAILMQQS